LLGSAAWATVLPRPWKLDRINRGLQGTLLDFTRNHGADRRIWSSALGQKRDLYVYLPPGFDPNCRYPACIWLHGFAQDEQKFAEEIAPRIDAAIVAGNFPDHLRRSRRQSQQPSCLVTAGGFFVNYNAGRFGDFIMQDVWPFRRNFPSCPSGATSSPGVDGGGAVCAAMKHRDSSRSARRSSPLNTRRRTVMAIIGRF
jgi:hypothetical protein